MYHPVKSLQDFTKSIMGLWLNPQTKNQYFFSAHESDSSTGEVNILQKGASVPVALQFDLKTKDEKLFLTVEGAQYNILLSDIPVHSLYITLSPGNTLRLLKQ